MTLAILLNTFTIYITVAFSMNMCLHIRADTLYLGCYLMITES